MRIFSWNAGHGWSSWHILHLGQPLCDTPVPSTLRGKFDRELRPCDFANLCAKCRELAIKAASAPIEIEGPAESCPACGYYKRGQDGTCVSCGADWPLHTRILTLL